MALLSVEAKDEQLDFVNDFIHEQIQKAAPEVPVKLLMQIDICVEEIFVNIAHYAYGKQTGLAQIECTVLPVTSLEQSNALELTIVFTDSGVPFNPLLKPDPDVTLGAEERQIGGLGIFITKKYMDSVEYKNANGQNILTLKKLLKS